MSENSALPKTPFNDLKHIPTRAEIDLELGILCAIQLKEFEHKLDLITSDISWSMYWHNATEGWSYRASFTNKVLCIIHFYKKHFIVTTALALPDEQEYLELKELTAEMRKKFDEAVHSPGSKWISFRVKGKEDSEGVIAILKRKISFLRESKGGKKKRSHSSNE